MCPVIVVLYDVGGWEWVFGSRSWRTGWGSSQVTVWWSLFLRGGLKPSLRVACHNCLANVILPCQVKGLHVQWFRCWNERSHPPYALPDPRHCELRNAMYITNKLLVILLSRNERDIGFLVEIRSTLFYFEKSPAAHWAVRVPVDEVNSTDVPMHVVNMMVGKRSLWHSNSSSNTARPLCTTRVL